MNQGLPASFDTAFLNQTARRLADAVRQARLGQNMTQAMLAEYIGVSLPTYKKFEKTGEISLMKFLHVLRVLGRSQDVTFIALNEPRTPEESRQRQRKRARRTRTAKP
jgi:transcriptional regulator with XRE-family HTH domain